MIVEEFTMEFDQLLMTCNIKEPEEQTIAGYLEGLKSEIEQVVQPQSS